MDASDTRTLLDIARHAAESQVRGEPFQPEPLPAPYDGAKPVFVTVRSPDGRLRGCIGHLSAVHGSLAEEIADCAVKATTQDPRFPAVTPDELEGLSYEISILEPAEPVDDLTTLDPRQWGVIVRRGARRGVLLPDIAGVDTVEDQLSIACRKAGIAPTDPIEVERFAVTKVAE